MALPFGMNSLKGDKQKNFNVALPFPANVDVIN
jgi:hypothetical protein